MLEKYEIVTAMLHGFDYEARSFAAMLERAVNQYRNRSLETAEVIRQLIELRYNVGQRSARSVNRIGAGPELRRTAAMAEDIKVQELYGIGKKYDVGCSRGQRVSVVIRKDGRRELYSFETDAEEPTSVIELSEEQARKLGAVLSGTYFSG